MSMFGEVAMKSKNILTKNYNRILLTNLRGAIMPTTKLFLLFFLLILVGIGCREKHKPTGPIDPGEGTGNPLEITPDVMDETYWCYHEDTENYIFNLPVKDFNLLGFYHSHIGLSANLQRHNVATRSYFSGYGFNFTYDKPNIAISVYKSPPMPEHLRYLTGSIDGGIMTLYHTDEENVVREYKFVRIPIPDAFK